MIQQLPVRLRASLCWHRSGLAHTDSVLAYDQPADLYRQRAARARDTLVSTDVHSNTVIGTLAIDGVGCYIWYSEDGTGRGRSSPRLLIAVPNVTVHPLTAGVPISYYFIWHYNCLWSLKG